MYMKLDPIFKLSLEVLEFEKKNDRIKNERFIN